MASHYSIVEYSSMNKDIWDQFVEDCDEAWFWHSSYFMKAWQQGKNISYAIVDEHNSIVLMQALYFIGEVPIKRKWHKYHQIVPYYGKRSTNCFMSVGGFCRKNGLTAKEEHNLQKKYIEHMDELIQKYQVVSFGYSIQATLSKAYLPQCCPLINPMIFYGYRNTMSQSYIIDLKKDDEDIFKDFQQTTRNLINRCKRDTSIMVEEAKATQEDLDKYYALHVETYTRTGVSPHPKAYFEHIFLEILKAGLCHILFLYKEGQLVAAQNTLLFKGVAMYWTGASLSEKGEGENRLLMYEQILYAKHQGASYYECGEAFPNVRYGKLKGLNDYKKAFGGFIHPVFSGEYIIFGDQR